MVKFILQVHRAKEPNIYKVLMFSDQQYKTLKISNLI